MKKNFEALAGEVAALLNEKNLSRLARLLHHELSRRKKIASLDRFTKLLKQERAKREGRLFLEITSARGLAEEEKRTIEEKLARKYRPQQIETAYRENRTILGGLKISSTSETIDLSWRGKINELKKAIGASYG